MTPERTFAVVVGVEQYATAGMRLPGAAQDALRVAGWLTGRAGVPAANVRLFISPLETAPLDWSCVSEHSYLKAHHRAATGSEIRRALFTDLADCDGDLLWFYWAGHGFRHGHSGMLLPYADAGDQDLLHLDLDSMLRTWNSTSIPSGRFNRQVVIVDACHADLGARSAKSLGGYVYPIGETTVLRRRQFVLYAARQGQAAKNQAELMSGQFTRTLLDQIETTSLEQCVPRLPDIARAVQAHFKKLREEDEAWQEPHFAVHRDWDGAPFLEDGWAANQCAPKLDQQAWDEIDALFARQHGLPAHTYDAYCWAFEVTGCAVPPVARAEWEQILQVMADLDERCGARPDMPLVLPFIKFLASRAWTDDPEFSKQLGLWVERTRERLGAEALQPPPKLVTRRSLYVRLEESTRQFGTYYVKMWLHDGKYTYLEDTDSGPFSASGIREQVTAQLARLSRRSAGAVVTRVDFQISLAMLDSGRHADLEFEAWPVPIGKNGKSIPLGAKCEVVVRFSEDRAWPEDDWWREKWHWLDTYGGKHPKAVQVLSRNDPVSGVNGRFAEDGPPVCALVESADPAEALVALVEAGIPIAVWRRGDDAARAGGACPDLATLLAAGDQAGAPLDVRSIPGTVQRLWKNSTAPLYPLALMWDDPTRLPDITPLSC